MAYGHLNEVCAPRRKRYEDWFHKRLIRYHTVMVILTALYRRGELSLRTWYRAEQIAAERSKLPENSIYRLWHPDYGGASQSNVPSGSTTYRKTNKTNKDRLHRALLPYAVGLFVHRMLSGLMSGRMVISPATRR